MAFLTFFNMTVGDRELAEVINIRGRPLHLRRGRHGRRVEIIEGLPEAALGRRVRRGFVGGAKPLVLALDGGVERRSRPRSRPSRPRGGASRWAPAKAYPHERATAALLEEMQGVDLANHMDQLGEV